jgi:plastocyanin
VVIGEAAFTPSSVTIHRGQQVRWVNLDGATHTVTFDDGVDSGKMSGASSFTRGFATAGTFAYHCALHPAMKGTVTVTP